MLEPLKICEKCNLNGNCNNQKTLGEIFNLVNNHDGKTDINYKINESGKCIFLSGLLLMLKEKGFIKKYAEEGV